MIAFIDEHRAAYGVEPICVEPICVEPICKVLPIARFRQLSEQAAERRVYYYQRSYQAAEIKSRSAATRWT